MVIYSSSDRDTPSSPSSLSLPRFDSFVFLRRRWAPPQVLLVGGDGGASLFGKADVELPADGPPKDQSVVIAAGDGARAVIHVKTAWFE